MRSNNILGVNGFGRIGKLTVWHQVARKYFDGIVVNNARQSGTSLADIAHYVERDSTYGWLHGHQYGYAARPVISDLDEDSGTMMIDGVKVRFLRHHRDPSEIGWGAYNVRLVVDTTYQFLDPAAGTNQPQGTVRGHLASGADKVIISAPFKIKHESAPMPEDTVTTVMGINDSDYDPRRHRIIVHVPYNDSLRDCIVSMGNLSVIIAKGMLQGNLGESHPGVTYLRRGKEPAVPKKDKQAKGPLKKFIIKIGPILIHVEWYDRRRIL